MKRFTNALLALVLVLTLVFGAACQTLDNHEHKPVAEQTIDETGHWYACTFEGCTEKLNFTAHTGGEATYTEVATCTICGRAYGDVIAHDCEWEETSRTVTCIKDGKIVTKTNHCGGILGGITNGMPLIFRAAFKPTPSIARPQQTVNLQTREVTEIRIEGRHDPCIVHRAVPVVEAMTALAILDTILTERK